MNKIYFFLLMLATSSLFGMEDMLIQSKLDSIKQYSKEQIVTLQRKYPDNINCQDEKGMTPLMYAVTFNNLEILQELVNEGADVSIATPLGITAIDIANLLDYQAIVNFLLNASYH